jgi:type IV fimbrial biogenesis protein FimT
MMHRAFGQGFSLIELMMAIVIFSLLVMLAAPMYSEFIGNSYIRNAAEAVLDGVRLAQAQAIKANVSQPTAPAIGAAFVLDPAAGWTVYLPDPNDGTDQVFKTYSFVNEGASKATITTNSSTTTVTFDGLGRALLTNGDGSAQLTQIDITNTNVPTPHPLRVVVSTIAGANGIKLCDPALVSTDPAGCP